MNFRKKELEDYAYDKQMKHLCSYLDQSNVSERKFIDENFNSEISKNSESFDDIINEKNCLIEELKSCLELMQVKFDEEVIRYSKEVFIIYILNLSS